MSAASIYRLKNVLTKTIHEGTAYGLSEMYGFRVQDVINAYNRGALLDGLYTVEIIGETLEPYQKRKRKKNNINQDLDELAVEATKHHMTYGQYVAMTEHGRRRHI